MTKRTIDISRRHVLFGAAGFTLALPFLPSLAEKSAFGGDPIYQRKPRLFWMTSNHGGAWESNMFPDPALLTQKTAMLADHQITSGALKAKRDGDRAVVSPVLSAPAALLTDKLVSKMNVIHGLDVPYYISHNTGLHLGNYARNDGNGGDGQAVQKFPRPTIDQILAYSPTFYGDLSTTRERTMIMGGPDVSWNYSDVSSQSGSIQKVSGIGSSKELFDKIFVPPDTSSTPKRPPIADRVLESYKTLRNGSRRLSAADKQRLDDHIDHLAELERKLTVKASCGDIQRPSDDFGNHQALDAGDAGLGASLAADVMFAAFTCGTSRIGILPIWGDERFAGYKGDWHQDVAHQWQTPDKQAILVRAYQTMFERAFLYLASKMDVEEAPGVTYLDNSLLVWSQECCVSTHDSQSIPIVTFGSAAGFFNTGLFVDYQRKGNPDSKVPLDPASAGINGALYLGVLYSQWLANVLLAMGIPNSEFERWGHKGYGYPYLSGSYPAQLTHYGSTSSRYYQMASDPLPILKG